jgi:hypothetical protein
MLLEYAKFLCVREQWHSLQILNYTECIEIQDTAASIQQTNSISENFFMKDIK